MLCHCACKHVRLSCVLNKLLTYLLTYLRKNYQRSMLKFILCGSQHMLALNYMIKPICWLGQKQGISILRSLQHQHSSFDNAPSLSIDIAIKWQQKQQREVTGQLTRQFILHITSWYRTKILFLDCRQIGISYCRMLLNDTMLMMTVIELVRQTHLYANVQVKERLSSTS